jgi:hypothetical protein
VAGGADRQQVDDRDSGHGGALRQDGTAARRTYPRPTLRRCRFAPARAAPGWHRRVPAPAQPALSVRRSDPGPEGGGTASEQLVGRWPGSTAGTAGNARQVLADARDLLGGNGILLDFRVIQHLADVEAVHTFEGTEAIQTLVVGRDITGLRAFA